MPRTYEKRLKRWNTEDANKALIHVRNGMSMRKAAAKFGMSEGTLRFLKKKNSRGESLDSQSGKSTALPQNVEENLARCIGVLCKLGFSPSKEEIMSLVAEYIKVNQIKVGAFKNGRPGYDWFTAFMKRNNLSLKKANMISSARKSATANPFIINDFFDLLEETVQRLNLPASAIWNCDESGFPTDPQRSKVVSVKGETAYKVTSGARRENISTLAVCNAEGKALDPLIIFQGKNMQSTWKGEKALPYTLYGRSDNGWMTTEIFALWFENFCEMITERPLLLIYDGHLTHISLQLLHKAKEENVHIIKFPPHVTDVLQPLDVACFGPLKRVWEKMLNDRLNELGPKARLDKATFVDKLCEVWHAGLKSENIISGFTSTGIFPVDRTKYPESRYDVRLLARYERWVSAGKPVELQYDLATSVSTPKKMKTATIETPESVSAEGPSSSTPTTNENSENIADADSVADSVACCCAVSREIGPIPKPAPPGFQWHPKWELLPEIVADPEPSTNKSFEELLLDKTKGPTEKPKVKRMKVDLMAKLVSHTTYIKALELRENESKKLGGKKAAKKVEADEEESDEELQGIPIEESSAESSEEYDDQAIPGSVRQTIHSLNQVWKLLNPPETEDSIVGKWFACIYGSGRKQKLYVAKVRRRFLFDKDGPTESVELECLKPNVGSGNILESAPPHLPDIDRFDISNVIAGPIIVKPLKSGRWEVPSYNNLKTIFNFAVKINREKELNDFNNKSD